MSFDIIPAIDLFDREAVRLHKGSYEEKTVYSKEPEKLARTFVSAGCKRIHVVDLNAARTGDRGVNAGILGTIVDAARGARVQTGGGIRDARAVEECLALGVDRVILGTKAAKNPDTIAGFVRQFGADKIVIGVDARDGRIMVQGWEEDSGHSMAEFLKLLESAGVRTIVATNIASDGTLSGVSLDFYREILRECTLEVIVSGGVSGLSDVDAIAAMNESRVCGMIVGKAWYEGRIELSEAVKRAG
jgi:phosphoribosylformimino-5-aminoimidazole carboxamide ribotide isomerase